MPLVCFTQSAPMSTYMDFHNYIFKSCFRWAEVLLCSAVGLVWLRHQSMVSDGYGLCVRVFFCSFIFSYRMHGSRLSCLETLLVGRAESLWMPVSPQGYNSVAVYPPLQHRPAMRSCCCLRSKLHMTTDFFSQVSLNTWLQSGNAGSAESLMQSVTTPVQLRMDFHLYSFAGSHVAKWHWAEKSIKWNVFVSHLVELLMSSLALIHAN